jgi:hypothetical protein
MRPHTHGSHIARRVLLTMHACTCTAGLNVSILAELPTGCGRPRCHARMIWAWCGYSTKRCLASGVLHGLHLACARSCMCGGSKVRCTTWVVSGVPHGQCPVYRIGSVRHVPCLPCPLASMHVFEICAAACVAGLYVWRPAWAASCVCCVLRVHGQGGVCRLHSVRSWAGSALHRRCCQCCV